MKTPRVFRLLSAVLMALAVGIPFCLRAQAADSGDTNVPYRPSFMIGADISAVPAAEARGRKWTDNGVQKDILQILKDHGFNYIRLRIFVEPTNAGGYSRQGYCGLDQTIAMAKRVKAAGMGFLLDFHYSDTWADPGKQTKPLAWRELPLDQLITTVHDYTKDVVSQLKTAGAEPDMVQIGNEITPGMLLNTLPGRRGGGGPTQISTQPEGSTRDWTILASLLNAGIKGAKEVDPRILIVLHIDKGGDNRTSRRWVDSALEHGVSFDVLGESCYTQWQGQPSAWRTNFTDLAARYPKLSFIAAEIADEVTTSNEILHGLPDHRGLGTFVWEPTQSGNRQQLFDNQGAVMPDRMAKYDQIVKEFQVRP